MKKTIYEAPACEVTKVVVENMLASSVLTPGGGNTGIQPGDEGYGGEFNSTGEWDIWTD
ncbi:MAG: hypothetical protein NC388_03890 [Clostridium sp.]|nr:hypothetical protein [Clostridium sp.]